MGNKNTIIEIFSGISENADYSEQRTWFRKKEYEYEKRSINSLLYGSGGAITFLLGLAGNSKEPDAILTALLVSLVCFLICLILTGAAQFLLNELSSLRFQEFTCANNAQNFESSLNKLEAQEKIYGILRALNISIDANDESFSSSRFELKDKAIKLKQQQIEFKERADKFDIWIAWLMRIAAIAFMIALAFPVLKILCGGTFYG